MIDARPSCMAVSALARIRGAALGRHVVAQIQRGTAHPDALAEEVRRLGADFEAVAGLLRVVQRRLEDLAAARP